MKKILTILLLVTMACTSIIYSANATSGGIPSKEMPTPQLLGWTDMSVEIIEVELTKNYDRRCDLVRATVKNNRQESIDAIDFVIWHENTYGEAVTEYGLKDSSYLSEYSFSDFEMKPGQTIKFGMKIWNDDYPGIKRSHVAVSRYHTTEPKTFKAVYFTDMIDLLRFVSSK